MNEQADTLANLIGWLQSISPALAAVVLSIITAVLRVVYGGGSIRQMLLEGALCGAVTLALVPLLQWLGLPDNMATFAGGMTGFVGVEELRRWAIRLGQRKSEGQ
ncbi:phage holin, lambda family [Pseudomonas linyingensis]|uniref:Phage holin, lambda family n=1 Tax=Pseudomonas linyingensis TaxID=915471 RepID=A0A1H6YZ71_9PSED|nr:phage holin, lambda family [Pseudomonas linyingensis]SEJ46518.1 phage holin, lambda family [Pseudomonas linyingensis]